MSVQNSICGVEEVVLLQTESQALEIKGLQFICNRELEKDICPARSMSRKAHAKNVPQIFGARKRF